MKKRNTYRTLLAFVSVVTLLLAVPSDTRKGLLARSQDQQAPASQNSQGQQPSASQTGPTSQPGETVLVPKKAAPPNAAAASAPDEKKPEKINPKDVYTLSTATNLVNVDVLVTDK